jgi:hypothetical protein
MKPGLREIKFDMAGYNTQNAHQAMRHFLEGSERLQSDLRVHSHRQKREFLASVPEWIPTRI